VHAAVTVGSEGNEQQPSHCVVVERVEVEAVWRQLAAAIALVPGAVEVVDRCADHGSATLLDERRQLIPQRRLSGRVDAVDPHAQRMPDRHRRERRSQLVEHGCPFRAHGHSGYAPSQLRVRSGLVDLN
jgi:hypothetical protein